MYLKALAFGKSNPVRYKNSRVTSVRLTKPQFVYLSIANRVARLSIKKRGCSPVASRGGLVLSCGDRINTLPCELAFGVRETLDHTRTRPQVLRRIFHVTLEYVLIYDEELLEYCGIRILG